MVDDKHLDRAGVGAGDGSKKVDDGGFVGEIGLDDVEGGVCLQEREEWVSFTVVVRGDFSAERWHTRLKRKYRGYEEELTAVEFGGLETDTATCT